LALSVAQQGQIEASIREQVLFLTAGLVVLTIVINGGTISTLLQWLGLAQLPPAKQATVVKAEGLIHNEVADLLEALHRDPLLAHADWPSIERSLQGLRLSAEFQPREPGPQEDLAVFYKRQLLESERQNYWNQFGLGLLDQGAAARLVEAVEAALDGVPELGPRARLQALWSEPLWLERLARWGWLRRSRFQHLAAVYGTLRGYLQAQQALLTLATDLAPDPAMAEAVRRQIGANLEQAQALLAQLRHEHGSVVAQLETYTALRLLLNRQREAVQHLADEGVLEPAESRKLIERVEERMFELARGRADALEMHS
ncbi:peptidase, partial [Pseudomonas sp. CrR25]|nr:peptidase [Pseudomonas sp. CrR25]